MSDKTQPDQLRTALDKIFEDYRVLIMNGLQQGLSYSDIATEAEIQATRAINALFSKTIATKTREARPKVGYLVDHEGNLYRAMGEYDGGIKDAVVVQRTHKALKIPLNREKEGK